MASLKGYFVSGAGRLNEPAASTGAPAAISPAPVVLMKLRLVNVM